MDIWSKEKRSHVMSRIRSKDTRPEVLLRSCLFAEGFRFRIHDTKLPGKPDIVFRKYKTVVFVNGCFWHFHEQCKEGRIPSTNSAFWKNKLLRNIERDHQNRKRLEHSGWNVVVVWECELNTREKLEITVVNVVTSLLKKGRPGRKRNSS
jgi:DNA mismatch endonuclease, patch repair protein